MTDPPRSSIPGRHSVTLLVLFFWPRRAVPKAPLPIRREWSRREMVGLPPETAWWTSGPSGGLAASGRACAPLRCRPQLARIIRECRKGLHLTRIQAFFPALFSELDCLADYHSAAVTNCTSSTCTCVTNQAQPGVTRRCPFRLSCSFGCPGSCPLSAR